MRPVIAGAVVIASLAVSLVAAGEAHGQAYRGWAGTSVQFVEVRPLGLDTVPSSAVVTDLEGNSLFEGHEVTCVVVGICTGYLPLAERRAVAATQDLSLTFWGLGVQGVSVTTLVRVRARTGGELVWPRSDDEFDAVLAYGQLRRGSVRVRAGRQEIRSGLGISGFDGVSAALDRRSYRGEVYGGRSLTRGLREPGSDALRGLEDFFIDRGVLLVGGSATLRRWGTLLTGRYHREIHSDRSGLVSERASLDASTAFPRATLRASLDYDFSFQRVGKADVTLSSPLAGGRWLLEVSGHRYVPYFDLSTLWGFFEPVAYSEIVARAGWSPGAELGLRLSLGRRGYGDTNTAIVLQPLRDVGWRADLAGRWSWSPDWALSGRYELEWGPGGFLSAADVAVRYAFDDRLGGALSVLSFQKIEEFRLGQGRALGAGASADYRFAERFSLAGGVSMLRHRDGGNVFTSPWNQSRAWTSLRIEMGRDPGLVRPVGRP